MARLIGSNIRDLNGLPSKNTITRSHELVRGGGFLEGGEQQNRAIRKYSTNQRRLSLNVFPARTSSRYQRSKSSSEMMSTSFDTTEVDRFSNNSKTSLPQRQTRPLHGETSSDETHAENKSGVEDVEGKWDTVEICLMPYQNFLTSQGKPVIYQESTATENARTQTKVKHQQFLAAETDWVYSSERKWLRKQTVRVERMGVTNLLDTNRQIYGNPNSSRKSAYTSNAETMTCVSQHSVEPDICSADEDGPGNETTDVYYTDDSELSYYAARIPSTADVENSDGNLPYLVDSVSSLDYSYTLSSSRLSHQGGSKKYQSVARVLPAVIEREYEGRRVPARHVSNEVLREYKRTALEILLQRKKENDKKILKESQRTEIGHNIVNPRLDRSCAKVKQEECSAIKGGFGRKTSPNVNAKRMDNNRQVKPLMRTGTAKGQNISKYLAPDSPNNAKRRQSMISLKKNVTPGVARIQAAGEMRPQSRKLKTDGSDAKQINEMDYCYTARENSGPLALLSNPCQSFSSTVPNGNTVKYYEEDVYIEEPCIPIIGSAKSVVAGKDIDKPNRALQLIQRGHDSFPAKPARAADRFHLDLKASCKSVAATRVVTQGLPISTTERFKRSNAEKNVTPASSLETNANDDDVCLCTLDCDTIQRTDRKNVDDSQGDLLENKTDCDKDVEVAMCQSLAPVSSERDYNSTVKSFVDVEENQHLLDCRTRLHFGIEVVQCKNHRIERKKPVNSLLGNSPTAMTNDYDDPQAKLSAWTLSALNRDTSMTSLSIPLLKSSSQPQTYNPGSKDINLARVVKANGRSSLSDQCLPDDTTEQDRLTPAELSLGVVWCDDVQKPAYLFSREDQQRLKGNRLTQFNEALHTNVERIPEDELDGDDKGEIYCGHHAELKENNSKTVQSPLSTNLQCPMIPSSQGVLIVNEAAARPSHPSENEHVRDVQNRCLQFTPAGEHVTNYNSSEEDNTLLKEKIKVCGSRNAKEANLKLYQRIKEKLLGKQIKNTRCSSIRFRSGPGSKQTKTGSQSLTPIHNKQVHGIFSRTVAKAKDTASTHPHINNTARARETVPVSFSKRAARSTPTTDVFTPGLNSNARVNFKTALSAYLSLKKISNASAFTDNEFAQRDVSSGQQSRPQIRKEQIWSYSDDEICNKRSSKDCEIPKQPTQDCEIPKQPTQDCEIPKQPTQDCEIPKQPTQDCEIPKQPTQDCEIPKQPTQDCETTKQPTQDCEITKQPTQDCEITKQPTQDCELTSINFRPCTSVTANIATETFYDPQGMRIPSESTSSQDLSTRHSGSDNNEKSLKCGRDDSSDKETSSGIRSQTVRTTCLMFLEQKRQRVQNALDTTSTSKRMSAFDGLQQRRSNAMADSSDLMTPIVNIDPSHHHGRLVSKRNVADKSTHILSDDLVISSEDGTPDKQYDNGVAHDTETDGTSKTISNESSATVADKMKMFQGASDSTTNPKRNKDNGRDVADLEGISALSFDNKKRMFKTGCCSKWARTDKDPSKIMVVSQGRGIDVKPKGVCESSLCRAKAGQMTELSNWNMRDVEEQPCSRRHNCGSSCVLVGVTSERGDNLTVAHQSASRDVRKENFVQDLSDISGNAIHVCLYSNTGNCPALAIATGGFSKWIISVPHFRCLNELSICKELLSATRTLLATDTYQYYEGRSVTCENISAVHGEKSHSKRPPETCEDDEYYVDRLRISSRNCTESKRPTYDSNDKRLDSSNGTSKEAIKLSNDWDVSPQTHAVKSTLVIKLPNDRVIEELVTSQNTNTSPLPGECNVVVDLSTPSRLRNVHVLLVQSPFRALPTSSRFLNTTHKNPQVSGCHLIHAHGSIMISGRKFEDDQSENMIPSVPVDKYSLPQRLTLPQQVTATEPNSYVTTLRGDRSLGMFPVYVHPEPPRGECRSKAVCQFRGDNHCERRLGDGLDDMGAAMSRNDPVNTTTPFHTTGSDNCHQSNSCDTGLDCGAVPYVNSSKVTDISSVRERDLHTASNTDINPPSGEDAISYFLSIKEYEKSISTGLAFLDHRDHGTNKINIDTKLFEEQKETRIKTASSCTIDEHDHADPNTVERLRISRDTSDERASCKDVNTQGQGSDTVDLNQPTGCTDAIRGVWHIQECPRQTAQQDREQSVHVCGNLREGPCARESCSRVCQQEQTFPILCERQHLGPDDTDDNLHVASETESSHQFSDVNTLICNQSHVRSDIDICGKRTDDLTCGFDIIGQVRDDHCMTPLTQKTTKLCERKGVQPGKDNNWNLCVSPIRPSRNNFKPLSSKVLHPGRDDSHRRPTSLESKNKFSDGSLCDQQTRGPCESQPSIKRSCPLSQHVLHKRHIERCTHCSGTPQDGAVLNIKERKNSLKWKLFHRIEPDAVNKKDCIGGDNKKRQMAEKGQHSLCCSPPRLATSRDSRALDSDGVEHKRDLALKKTVTPAKQPECHRSEKTIDIEITALTSPIKKCVSVGTSQIRCRDSSSTECFVLREDCQDSVKTKSVISIHYENSSSFAPTIKPCPPTPESVPPIQGTVSHRRNPCCETADFDNVDSLVGNGHTLVRNQVPWLNGDPYDNEHVTYYDQDMCHTPHGSAEKPAREQVSRDIERDFVASNIVRHPLPIITRYLPFIPEATKRNLPPCFNDGVKSPEPKCGMNEGLTQACFSRDDHRRQTTPNSPRKVYFSQESKRRPHSKKSQCLSCEDGFINKFHSSCKNRYKEQKMAPFDSPVETIEENWGPEAYPETYVFLESLIAQGVSTSSPSVKSDFFKGKGHPAQDVLFCQSVQESDDTSWSLQETNVSKSKVKKMVASCLVAALENVLKKRCSRKTRADGNTDLHRRSGHQDRHMSMKNPEGYRCGWKKEGNRMQGSPLHTSYLGCETNTLAQVSPLPIDEESSINEVKVDGYAQLGCECTIDAFESISLHPTNAVNKCQLQSMVQSESGTKATISKSLSDHDILSHWNNLSFAKRRSSAHDVIGPLKTDCDLQSPLESGLCQSKTLDTHEPVTGKNFSRPISGTKNVPPRSGPKVSFFSSEIIDGEPQSECVPSGDTVEMTENYNKISNDDSWMVEDECKNPFSQTSNDDDVDYRAIFEDKADEKRLQRISGKRSILSNGAQTHSRYDHSGEQYSSRCVTPGSDTELITPKINQRSLHASVPITATAIRTTSSPRVHRPSLSPNDFLRQIQNPESQVETYGWNDGNRNCFDKNRGASDDIPILLESKSELALARQLEELLEESETNSVTRSSSTLLHNTESKAHLKQEKLDSNNLEEPKIWQLERFIEVNNDQSHERKINIDISENESLHEGHSSQVERKMSPPISKAKLVDNGFIVPSTHTRTPDQEVCDSPISSKQGVAVQMMEAGGKVNVSDEFYEKPLTLSPSQQSVTLDVSQPLTLDLTEHVVKQKGDGQQMREVCNEVQMAYKFNEQPVIQIYSDKHMTSESNDQSVEQEYNNDTMQHKSIDLPTTQKPALLLTMDKSSEQLKAHKYNKLRVIRKHRKQSRTQDSCSQPLTLDISEQATTEEDNEQSITLDISERTITQEVNGQPLKLNISQQGMTKEADEQSITLEISEQAMTEEDNEQSITLDISERIITQEVNEQPLKLNISERTITEEVTKQPLKLDIFEQGMTEEADEQSITLEISERTLTQEDKEQPLKLDISEQGMTEEADEQSITLEISERKITQEDKEQPLKLDISEQGITEEADDQSITLEISERTLTQEDKEQPLKLDISEQGMTVDADEQSITLDISERTLTQEDKEQPLKLDISEQGMTEEADDQSITLEISERTLTQEDNEQSLQLEIAEQAMTEEADEQSTQERYEQLAQETTEELFMITKNNIQSMPPEIDKQTWTHANGEQSMVQRSNESPMAQGHNGQVMTQECKEQPMSQGRHEQAVRQEYIEQPKSQVDNQQQKTQDFYQKPVTLEDGEQNITQGNTGKPLVEMADGLMAIQANAAPFCGQNRNEKATTQGNIGQAITQEYRKLYCKQGHCDHQACQEGLNWLPSTESVEKPLMQYQGTLHLQQGTKYIQQLLTPTRADVPGKAAPLLNIQKPLTPEGLQLASVRDTSGQEANTCASSKLQDSFGSKSTHKVVTQSSMQSYAENSSIYKIPGRTSTHYDSMASLPFAAKSEKGSVWRVSSSERRFDATISTPDDTPTLPQCHAERLPFQERLLQSLHKDDDDLLCHEEPPTATQLPVREHVPAHRTPSSLSRHPFTKFVDSDIDASPTGPDPNRSRKSNSVQCPSHSVSEHALIGVKEGISEIENAPLNLGWSSPFVAERRRSYRPCAPRQRVGFTYRFHPFYNNGKTRWTRRSKKKELPLTPQAEVELLLQTLRVGTCPPLTSSTCGDFYRSTFNRPDKGDSGQRSNRLRGVPACPVKDNIGFEPYGSLTTIQTDAQIGGTLHSTETFSNQKNHFNRMDRLDARYSELASNDYRTLNHRNLNIDKNSVSKDSGNLEGTVGKRQCWQPEGIHTYSDAVFRSRQPNSKHVRGKPYESKVVEGRKNVMLPTNLVFPERRQSGSTNTLHKLENHDSNLTGNGNQLVCHPSKLCIDSRKVQSNYGHLIENKRKAFLSQASNKNPYSTNNTPHTSVMPEANQMCKDARVASSFSSSRKSCSYRGSERHACPRRERSCEHSPTPSPLPVQVEMGSPREIVRNFLSSKARPVQLPVDVYSVASRRSVSCGKESPVYAIQRVAISGPVMNLSVPVYHHHDNASHQQGTISTRKSEGHTPKVDRLRSSRTEGIFGKNATNGRLRFKPKTASMTSRDSDRGVKFDGDKRHGSSLKPDHPLCDKGADPHAGTWPHPDRKEQHTASPQNASKTLNHFKQKMKKVFGLRKS